MKSITALFTIAMALLLGGAEAMAQSNTFTYQGQIAVQSGSPTVYNTAVFTLYPALTGGSQLAPPETNAISVNSNGIFTTTLTFGSLTYSNPPYYLQIGLGSNVAGPFTTLTPRQLLTPTPNANYAFTAGNAGTASSLTGTLLTSQLSGQISNSQLANSSVSVNAGTGLSGGGSVGLGGSLTLNNTGVTSLSSGGGVSVNVNSGAVTLNSSPINLSYGPGLSGSGSVSLGGTLSLALGTIPSSSLSGTYSSAVTFNNASDSFTGNGANLTGVNAATLGGYSVCSIPCYWWTTGNAGTTPGTDFVGTTDNNRLELHVNNTRALVLSPDPTGDNSANLIGGYNLNLISGSVSGDVIAGGGYSGSINVMSNSSWSAIGGGAGNLMSFANLGVIGGGYQNVVNAFAGTVGGGTNNAAGYFGTVAGGANNNASGTLAAVGGGQGNTASGSASFIGGGGYDGTTSSGNSVAANAAAIGGGLGNSIVSGATYAFIGAGTGNNIASSSLDSVIGGGVGNTNTSGAGYSVIGGGQLNRASSGWSVIGGGANNVVGSGTVDGTIGGGGNNTNTGSYATVPGGSQNLASAFYAFAAGYQAQAINEGALVWADSSGTPFASTNNNSFNVRAAGGFDFYTTSSGRSGSGVFLAAGASSWASVSDRNAKKNIQPVDGRAVLEKLAEVPIAQWNYKWEDDSQVPNIGPMAQDFKAAFYPGRDDKSITTMEFDGVELAAIQALNQKLEEQVKEKDTRIQSLEERLERLEKIVSHSSGNQGEAAK